jgi:hypothetical protein
MEFYRILHELNHCITWKASKALHVSLHCMTLLITSLITRKFSWLLQCNYIDITVFITWFITFNIARCLTWFSSQVTPLHNLLHAEYLMDYISITLPIACKITWHYMWLHVFYIYYMMFTSLITCMITWAITCNFTSRYMPYYIEYMPYHQILHGYLLVH